MRLRIIIVGAGKMGRAHIEAFTQVPEAEVVGVVSRSGETASKLAAEFGIPVSGSDWREVANRTGAEAAVVAVSHLDNASITRSVVDAGLHVLAEKPVALSSVTAAEIARAAEEKGVTALAAVNRRYYSGLLDGLNLARLVGQPYHIHIIAPDSAEPRRAQKTQSDAVCDAWFVMNTIHAVDLLRMFGGEPVSVRGFRRQHPRRDDTSITASILFTSGMSGTFVMPGGLNVEWDLRLSGDGYQLEARPLESVFFRTKRQGPGRRMDTPPAKGTKPGLLDQACAFVDAATQRIPPPFPASSLGDHARTLALVETLSRLPSE